MVVAGVGVTLLPELACLGGEARTPISTLRFADGSIGREVGLFWRRSSAQTATMEALAALIRHVAESLGQLGPPTAAEGPVPAPSAPVPEAG